MMYFHPLPSLSCREASKNCFYKYCTFSGRARRSEFWYFIFTCCILMIIPFSLVATGAYFAIRDYINAKEEEEEKKDKHKHDDDDDDDDDNNLFGSLKKDVSLDLGVYIIIIIAVIIGIILIIPLISSTVRRLHDTGRSGCYYFLGFIPFVNIILFIFLTEDSKQTINQYGPSPKYILIQNGTIINSSLGNSQTASEDEMAAPSSSQGIPPVNTIQPCPNYPPIITDKPSCNQEKDNDDQEYPSNEDLSTPMISS